MRTDPLLGARLGVCWGTIRLSPLREAAQRVWPRRGLAQGGSMYRNPVISAFVLALVGTLTVGPAPQATAAQAATPAAASQVAAGDFSGLVDIGGRKLYLECRGQGSPTVILEAGAFGRADVWSRDNLHPAGARTMVLPGVAAFTRVCAYDRPGTMGEVNPALDPHSPVLPRSERPGSPAAYHAGQGRRPAHAAARR